MSVTTTKRQASTDEIAAEMDRRGKAIEDLEARLSLRDTFIADKGLWHEFASTRLSSARAS